jgi:hypothetical protein
LLKHHQLVRRICRRNRKFVLDSRGGLTRSVQFTERSAGPRLCRTLVGITWEYPCPVPGAVRSVAGLAPLACRRTRKLVVKLTDPASPRIRMFPIKPITVSCGNMCPHHLSWPPMAACRPVLRAALIIILARSPAEASASTAKFGGSSQRIARMLAVEVLEKTGLRGSLLSTDAIG